MFERLLLVTLLNHSRASPGHNPGASHPDWLGPPLPRRNSPEDQRHTCPPLHTGSILTCLLPLRRRRRPLFLPRVFSVPFSHSLRLRASLRAHFASCPGVASGFSSGFPSGAVRTQNFTSSFLLLLFQPALLASPLSLPFTAAQLKRGEQMAERKRKIKTH